MGCRYSMRYTKFCVDLISSEWICVILEKKRKKSWQKNKLCTIIEFIWRWNNFEILVDFIFRSEGSKGKKYITLSGIGKEGQARGNDRQAGQARSGQGVRRYANGRDKGSSQRMWKVVRPTFRNRKVAVWIDVRSLLKREGDSTAWTASLPLFVSSLGLSVSRCKLFPSLR